MASTARKFGLRIGAALAVLALALLVAPALIDLDGYKPQIVAEVKQATGRDVVLGGPVSLRLLPWPRVTVRDVAIRNLPGAQNPDMVRVETVAVTPALLPLLVGDLQVAEVVLRQPRIVLEINATGKPNWELAPAAGEARPVAARAPGRPLSLGRLTIEDGTLVFSDAQAGLSVTGEKAQFSASVGAIDGPYALSGQAEVNGGPLRVDLTLGARGASGHAVDLALQAGGGRIAFQGTVSELGPAGRVAGKATAAADNLVTFVHTLVALGGHAAPPLPPLLGGRFRFEGAVEATPDSFASRDFTLALGDDTGTGSLALKFAAVPVVELAFAARRLDLDRWLASLQVPDEIPALEPVRPLNAPAPAAAASADRPRSPLLSVDGQIRVRADEIVYNRQAIRAAELELHTRGGIVALPRLHAILPGDLVIEARSTPGDGRAGAAAAGEFSLRGTRPRATLEWLGVDVSAVPAQRLREVAMHGRLASRPGAAEVQDATFQLDDLKGRGGIVAALSVPVSLVTSLDFDTVDIDSYLPQGDLAASTSAASPGGLPILALLGPAVGLKLRIARLLYRGDTIASVLLDVARDRGTLRLNDLKVDNLAGARLAVRGAVAGYWEERAQADVVFSFAAPDLSRVLHVAGITRPGIGAVSASGGLSGTLESLVLRDVTLSAMGWTGRASGTLSLPGAARGAPKAAAYRGTIGLNGHGLQASIDADLGERPNLVVDLKGETLDLARLRGASGGRAAGGSEPIDTAALRRFDGRFHIAVGTLIAGPFRLANADVAASLKGGVLTVAHVTGGLYGGRMDVSGTVDGSGPALAVDFRGRADGLPVADLLRSAAGSNVFGSVINVTLDGALNVDDLRVQGRGATSSELAGSLSGGARLGGHVRARADRFLQILGSAATGAVGGVVDATFGNLMSLAGDRGGVGFANLLNAISLVLHRFVNNDNALAGQVAIANGVLTAQGLTVQGSGATADVATQTNLAQATTRTTISFFINEDRSGPYLITTASGPLAGLSFSAVRGSAKDPPGLANLVPDLGRLIPRDPASLVPHIPVPHIPLPSLPNPFGR